MNLLQCWGHAEMAQKCALLKNAEYGIGTSTILSVAQSKNV